MFQVSNRKSRGRSSFQMAELIFFWTVRKLGGDRGNFVGEMLGAMAQSVLMVGALFLLLSALGMRMGGAPIRGDTVMYLASGIFLFICNIRTISAVVGAEGPQSPMLHHAPLNTGITIAAAALGKLYEQLLTISIMLLLYHLVTGKVSIQNPVGAVAMLILSWWVGVCIGLVLVGIKYMMPEVSSALKMIYQRLNMIFSGKMTPANTLSASMLPVFDWNPLFHVIDQARGFVFLNYIPHHTSIMYPIKLSLILLVLGMMGEFYGRIYISRSRSE